MAERLMRDGWLIYAVVILATGLILISLLGSLFASFNPNDQLGETFTVQHYKDVFRTGDLAGVIGRTVVLGLGSIGVMMFFSLPIAWLLARTDYPRKGWLFSLLIANIAIPGFITAMAYVFLFNPTAGIVNKLVGFTGDSPLFDIYSLGWICFLQGLVMVPVAVFMIVPSLRNLDASLEEACWMSGMSRFRAIWHVVLPLVLPAIVAAGLFFFIIAVELFDIVGLIGLPGNIVVLSTLIYDDLHPTYGLPNYGRAAVYGMMLFLLAGAAITFYIRLLRRAQRFQVVGGKLRDVQVQPLGRLTKAADVFVGVWVILAFVIPILTLFWTSLVPYLEPPSRQALDHLSFAGYVTALHYLAGPLKNTLVVMAVTLAIAVISSVCISWVVTRSRNRFGQWIDFLVFLSPAVPGMVAVVAFQYVALEIYHWVPIYGSLLLVTLVMGSRMLAFCTRTINGAALQLKDELDEAAYTSGMSRLTTFSRIYLPLTAPAVLYSAFIVAVLSAKELTIPLMMNMGTHDLVSTFIFKLQSNGSYEVSSAIGLYMIVVLLILVMVARMIVKRFKIDILS